MNETPTNAWTAQERQLVDWLADMAAAAIALFAVRQVLDWPR